MAKGKKPSEEEVLENVRDDLQAKVDQFLEEMTCYLVRHARTFRDDAVRSVCVDYSHVDPKKIKGIFLEIALASLEPDNMKEYNQRWQKWLTSEGE